MHQAIREWCDDQEPVPRKIDAMVCSLIRQRGRTSTPPTGPLGRVFFNEECFGGGVVSHEMAHVAFRLLNRRRVKVDHWSYFVQTQKGGKPGTHSTEETFCTLLEELVRQFWVEYYKLEEV